MNLRLLPSNPYAKLAYVWLIYLASPLGELMFPGSRRPPVEATLVSIAIFLPLYFWGYWVRGWRILVPIAGITALGLSLTPLSPGGSIFFIYAGAFAHRAGAPRRSVPVLAAIIGINLFEAWLVPMDWWPTFGAPAITAMIGGVTIYSNDTSRRLRTQLLQAQEEARHLAVVAERERISRDLHDLLGHSLSVIALKSELASKMADRDPVRAVAEIRDVERISREALAEVRSAVQGVGSGRGITYQAEQARAALEAAGIALDCEVVSIGGNSIQEQALALALREAVTNVIRHSAAKRCSIRLTVAAGRARLEVEDDGVGGGEDGTGLSGMRTRIVALGGQVDRRRQHGTRLVVTLPLGLGEGVAVPRPLETAT